MKKGGGGGGVEHFLHKYIKIWHTLQKSPLIPPCKISYQRGGINENRISSDMQTTRQQQR